MIHWNPISKPDAIGRQRVAQFAAALLLSLAIATPVHAAAGPSGNNPGCHDNTGMLVCNYRCVRSLGEACLVARIEFSGKAAPDVAVPVARFQTCRNAEVDLIARNLSLNSEENGSHNTKSLPLISVASSVSEMKLEAPVARIDGRTARFPFPEFLDSGFGEIEISIAGGICSKEEGAGTCGLSGTLVAVTNPNIRCEFGDESSPGSFIEQPVLTNPAQGLPRQ